jgi:hypothetical protein
MITDGVPGLGAEHCVREGLGRDSFAGEPLFRADSASPEDDCAGGRGNCAQRAESAGAVVLCCDFAGWLRLRAQWQVGGLAGRGSLLFHPFPQRTRKWMVHGRFFAVVVFWCWVSGGRFLPELENADREVRVPAAPPPQQAKALVGDPGPGGRRYNLRWRNKRDGATAW